MKDLEARIKELSKHRSEHKLKYCVNRIREIFLDFFINDLLDIKNWSYAHSDVFLSHKRRKKLTKEHYEFIRMFSTTQTFYNFQNLIKKYATPQERKFVQFIENFELKQAKEEESKRDESRQIIMHDQTIKEIGFVNMQEKYFAEGKFIPIKRIYTTQKTIETSYYRYIYFPKFLSILSTNLGLLNSISWPAENQSKVPKYTFFRNPKTPKPREISLDWIEENCITF